MLAWAIILFIFKHFEYTNDQSEEGTHLNHKSKKNTWKIAVTCNLFNTGAFTGLPLIKLSRRFDTLLKNWDIITEITDKFSVLFADTTNRNWVVMFKANKTKNTFWPQRRREKCLNHKITDNYMPSVPGTAMHLQCTCPWWTWHDPNMTLTWPLHTPLAE